jgi:hypothetical protein
MPYFNEHVQSRIPGLDCACLSNPVNDLLDGFFDNLESPEGEMAFILGEGVNRSDPGLFANALITHYFRAAVFVEPQQARDLAHDLNDLVCSDDEAIPSPVSCFYAHYTSSTKMLRYFNAGHRPPLLFRRNPDQVLYLDRGGPALGSELTPRYVQGAVQMQSGDRLVAFTNGVAKSWSSQDEQTADASLARIMKSWEHESAAEIASFIIHDAPGAGNSSQQERIVVVASVDDEQPTACHTFSKQLAAAV